MSKRGSGNIFSTGAIIAIIALLLCTQATAQESKPKSGFEKFKNFTLATVDFVDRLLNTIDTAYVTGNAYNMCIIPEYSYNYEHYSFEAIGDEKQCISIAPQSRNQLTFNIGWRWLFFGYSIDLQDYHPYTDININLYAPRFGLDLFYRKSSEGYKIKSLTGFYEEGKPLQGYNRDFNGIEVSQIGFNLYYVFNKRFSYPAAYAQSTLQRISAGSFILGVNYNHHHFGVDYEKIDPRISSQLNEKLKFKDMRYNDFSINFGYSYNWVLARNLIASASITPSLGYKTTTLKQSEKSNPLSGINVDVMTRASLVYNNGKYFAGTSLIAQAFHYKRDNLSIVNGFGVVNVYVGFNFWRKKK